MHHAPASAQMDECIQACLDCYRHCQNTALTYCLETGGEHVEPTHFRLMMDCAESCRSAAALMINDSRYHTESCRVCAQICRDCAESCSSLDGMESCVRACERCADSCEAMAAKGGARSKPGRTSHAAARPQ